MARMNIDPDPTVAFTELSLERMKVASQGRIGSGVLASARVESVYEHVIDQMAYRLQAEVLAERVLDTDAAVAFSGERRVATKVRVRGIALPFAVAAALCVAGIIVTSLPLVLGSMAVALLAVAMLYLNPGETVDITVPVDGTVTVPATYWRKFPESNLVYPRDLGGPVRFAVMHEPSYRAFEDDAPPEATS